MNSSASARNGLAAGVVFPLLASKDEGNAILIFGKDGLVFADSARVLNRLGGLGFGGGSEARGKSCALAVRGDRTVGDCFEKHVSSSNEANRSRKAQKMPK